MGAAEVEEAVARQQLIPQLLLQLLLPQALNDFSSLTTGTGAILAKDSNLNTNPPLPTLLRTIFYTYNETYGKDTHKKGELYAPTTSTNCPGGGNISVSNISVSGSSVNLTGTYNQCKIGSATLNGSLTISFSNVTSTSMDYTITTSSFTYSDSSISLTYSNTTLIGSFTISGNYLSFTSTINGTVSFATEGVSRSYQYDSFRITLNMDSSGSTISISGKIKGNCIGEWMTISTNTPAFVPTSSSNPTRGEFLITIGSDVVKVVYNSNSTISIYYNNSLVNTYTSSQLQGLCSDSSTTTTTTGSTPSAPTGITATDGSSQIIISWTDVSDATSYNIYWATTTGVTKTTGAKITGATSPYTHTGRTNGTTYYYVVTAVNSYGESSESSQVSATPQSTTIYTVTFNNKTFTEITITIDNYGTKTISSGGSTTYSIDSNSYHYTASTSGKTSEGNTVGKVLTWDYTNSITGTSDTVNLSISSDYFFIYLKNNGTKITSFYVNYGLVNETLDNIIIPGDGVKYSIGYYKIFSNTQIRAYRNYSSSYTYWDYGVHFTLPLTDNQSVTLTNTYKPETGNAIIFSQPDKKDEQIQNKGKQDEEVIIDYGKAVE